MYGCACNDGWFVCRKDGVYKRLHSFICSLYTCLVCEQCTCTYWLCVRSPWPQRRCAAWDQWSRSGRTECPLGPEQISAAAGAGHSDQSQPHCASCAWMPTQWSPWVAWTELEESSLVLYQKHTHTQSKLYSSVCTINWCSWVYTFLPVFQWGSLWS